MFSQRNCLLFAFLIAALFVIVDVSRAEKELPMTKMAQNTLRGPILSFYYCYSCGYRKAFDEYESILNEKYPDITIKGANYDPPGFSTSISKCILVTKLALIILIMSSVNVWRFFGREMPGWYVWCFENKLYACMMIFFVGNMIEAQLISSGAFEISLNDVPVWSKLQTGRIPAPQELFQIIDSHMQFADPLKQNPDFVK